MPLRAPRPLALALLAAVAVTSVAAPPVAPIAPGAVARAGDPTLSADVPVAQPRDFPAVMTLAVDATDLAHHVLRVHETLPVPPGPLTLLFPRWLPGDHGPYGRIVGLAGLQMRAGAASLAWRRDPVDPYAFHVDVPAGAGAVTVDFEYLSPTQRDNGRVVMTPQMLDLQWIGAVLYPAGYAAARIRVDAQARLPAGWELGSALPGTADAQGWWHFGTQSLATLADAPLYAGRHMKRVALDLPGASQPVVLDLFADEPSQLAASDAQLQAHRRLVQQADRLFGARHFRHYDFLLSLSDAMGGEGLEHHESSENGTDPDYFKDWDKGVGDRELLPHEFVHSWNGKFRRPPDLWTPDYNTVPMRDSLLWVYEGQTEYWGRVLAARSGLTTAAQARQAIAQTAAWAEHQTGRRWRSLQDTTNQATLGPAGDEPEWPSWQRRFDYYEESALLWLDADALIRERSGGRRSLDDFARAFFGMPKGQSEPAVDDAPHALTYTFADVVQALNAVQPLDWAAWLRERLDTHAQAPLAGLARSGWKLVYASEQSDDAKAQAEAHKHADFAYSLGLVIGADDDRFADVQWDSPAFAAGLAPGQRLVAVNGLAYKPERLAAAIEANRGGAQPIELLVKDGEQYRSVRIDYRGGLRYPKLERIAGTPDRLDAIFAPR
jgi:predicted metalloprotease with PDZ domain